MKTLDYLANMLCNSSNQIFSSVGFKDLIVMNTARTKAAIVYSIKHSNKTNTIKSVYALAMASFKNDR